MIAKEAKWVSEELATPAICALAAFRISAYAAAVSVRATKPLTPCSSVRAVKRGFSTTWNRQKRRGQRLRDILRPHGGKERHKDGAWGLGL